MKARKWLVALIALVMACTMGIAFAACEPVEPSGDDGGEDIVKLTVTYYDGASIITTREVEYGDPAPEIEAPEKDAHNFLGWFADPLHSAEYDFDAPIYKNTNIYAYYTQYKVYAATFRDAIPGVDGTDTLRGAEHSELVIPAAPVWEGHEFLGWKGSDGTLKNPGEKILLEGELDLAFTASWAEYTFEHVTANAATCTHAGNPDYYTCSACGKHFTAEDHLHEVENIVEQPTGHSYGDPTWKWEGLKATATFTCTKCKDEEGHEVTKEATVDGGRVTKEANCTEAGDKTYTATVEFNGTHKNEHVEVGVVDATGHTWEWKHDETSHWQECSVCHDARQNEHTHTYEDGVCTEPNCGYTMIAVTFEDGETSETKYAHKGKKVEDWPTPAEKDHFRFDGWYKEGVEEPFTAESTFDEPVTLTAKWVETVTVTFKAWGSVKEDTEVTVDKGTSLGDQLLAPTSTGYIFDGWFNGDDPFEADTTVTADVELTAKAHINTALLDTRYYGVVGGNGTDDLSSRNNWTPASSEYFQFTRSTDEIYVSGSTVYTVYKFTMYFTTSTQFKILYKSTGEWQWGGTCRELAAVASNGNIGTDKTGSVAKQSSGDGNLYVTKAGEYTLILRVTKTGTPSLYYTYNGASGTKPTYGTQAYVRGDFNNWLSDYNWYEGFRTNTLPDTYKLKNEGGSWYVDVNVTEATVSKPAEFKVFGINNLTWYPESENIKDITSPGLWRITWSGSGSPSAKQIVEYDVTYSLGDGYAGTSELPAPETVSSLDDYKLTLPEAPVWENHRFEGWDVNGVTHAAKETVTVTKSMTITAIWHELEEHTLTFKSWDEQALEGEQYAQKTHREDDVVTLPAGPERVGFSFTGWKEQGSETTYTDGTMKMPGKDVTLIATYTEAKDVTVTWHVDGERKGASENLRSGMSFTRDMITGVDDKDGYTLDGWYTSEDYTERFNFGIVADDADIYARFIRTTVTVTYADENGETLTTKEYSITVDGDVVTKYVTAETARYGKVYPNTTLEVWEVAANSWHLESAVGALYAGENLYDNTTLYGTLAEITTNRGLSSSTAQATHAKAIVVGGNDSPTGKYWSSVAFSATIEKYSSKAWNEKGTLKYQRDNTLKSNEIYTLRLRLAAGDNFRFVQQGTWTAVVKLANLAKSDATYFTAQSGDSDGNLHVVKAGVYDFVFYFNKSGTPTVYYNYVSAVSSSVKNYLEFTAGNKKESDRIELTSNTPIDVEITDTISAAKVIYAYIGDGMCDIYNASAAAAKTFSGGEGKYSVKFVRSSTITGAGTLTITKYNTFTLDYDLSDGVGTKPETFTITEAAATHSYTIDADDPTMTGYRFMGWQLNGNGTLYQKDGKVTLQPGENTLKAVFKQEFTVTFEKGDYPETATHEWDVKASEKVLIGEGVDLPELPDPGVEGKTYSRKWVVSGVEHDAGEHIEVTGDVTVTARYTELVNAEPVTVTWHILDLDGSEQTYTTEPMSGTQIAELVADAEGSYTSKAGHTLDGWYTENDYTADHKVDVWATAEKEHTYDFYARWYKTTVTVKFVIETPYSTSVTVTGTDSDETKSATIDGLTGTVTAPTQPAKKYMTFAGWEAKDEAKTKFTDGMHFLDDVTFYATWTETANASYQKDANYYYIYGHKSANTSSSLNKLTNWSATGKTLTFKRDESYKSHNVYYIDLTLYYGDTFQILHNGKAGYENGQMGFKYLDNTGKAFFSTNEEGWQADIIVAPQYDGEFHFTLSTDPTQMSDATQFTPGTGASLEYTRTKAVTAAKTSIDAFLIGDLVGSWDPTIAIAKTGTHFFCDSSLNSEGEIYTLYYKFTAQKEFKITSGTGWSEINIGRNNKSKLYEGGIWDIQDTTGKSNWSMLRSESSDNLYLNAGYGGWYRVELHIGTSSSNPYHIEMYRLTTS